MKKLSIFAAFAVIMGLGGFAFSAARSTSSGVDGPLGQEAVADQAEVADEAAAAQDGASSSVQPIAFPHSVHAGTYQMDCMYCHFSADRSVDAGLPAVQDCMGCHTLVPGTDNADEVATLRAYAERGEAIPWVRIYKVSDHVRFPHMRHIKAGLACQQCHGDVQRMGAIEERDPAWGGDNMGWCVSCHLERGARRDCTVCHY